ncbi:MAG: 2-oxoacid:acceptor oxidoreductase family protein [Oscillospiraceae bacterium]|nr:2-oxoacid:acceptor oxidoreductase family protein [Oscillospiraceae bacterium]
MKNLKQYLIAGFGGQGILFVGKLLANIGLISDKQVTWMPSYGPAMRGGTCNCSVCISDSLIGSPVVSEADVVIAMNGPSYDKFIGSVKKGGAAYIDSTLVDSKYDGDDITVHYVPATELAAENDLKGMANIIMLGKLIKESGLADSETVKKAIEASVSAKKANLLAANLRAIELGMNS